MLCAPSTGYETTANSSPGLLFEIWKIEKSGFSFECQGTNRKQHNVTEVTQHSQRQKPWPLTHDTVLILL